MRGDCGVCGSIIELILKRQVLGDCIIRNRTWRRKDVKKQISIDVDSDCAWSLVALDNQVAGLLLKPWGLMH